MSKLLLHAPAKINLGLEILRKRGDGYHDIKTVFCQVSLYDEIRIVRMPHFAKASRGEQNIIINCSDGTVPTNESNSVYKALKLLGVAPLRPSAGSGLRLGQGAKVYIKKNIPVRAGLGGGTADAAVVLKVFGSKDGLSIGSDVPYQMVGGTKLGEGRGEILSNLPSLAGINIVICVPEFGVETKWAYDNVDYSKIGKGKIEGLIRAVKKRDVFGIAKNLHNDFEYWVLPEYPEIMKIKKDMIKYGALGALMTGSGSGVFGVCGNAQTAKTVFEKMKKKYKKSFLVKIL